MAKKSKLFTYEAIFNYRMDRIEKGVMKHPIQWGVSVMLKAESDAKARRTINKQFNGVFGLYLYKKGQGKV